MDAGSYEPGRPDSSMFPASLKGSGVDGWPGEFWLDVRAAGPESRHAESHHAGALQGLSAKGLRRRRARQPRLVPNKPGFATTAADQLAYNQWLATTVHGLGLRCFKRTTSTKSTRYSRTSTASSTKSVALLGVLDACPVHRRRQTGLDAEYQEDGQSTAAFCAADAKANIVARCSRSTSTAACSMPCTNDVGLKN